MTEEQTYNYDTLIPSTAFKGYSLCQGLTLLTSADEIFLNAYLDTSDMRQSAFILARITNY